jgi:large conductance mechanosensitive channel
MLKVVKMSEEMQQKMLDSLKQIEENTAPKPPPPPVKGPEGFLEEFAVFLKKYSIVGLAIAVIIGGTAGRLVSALVTDILMPIINILIPSGAWQEAVWIIGPIQLAVGHFLAAIIDFLIIALVVFLIMKQIEKTPLA